MKPRTARLFCAVAVGVALLSLYLTFLSAFLSNPALYPQTTLEVTIVVAQMVKVAVILSFRRLRFAGWATIWVIFALDTLVIPFLTGAYIVTGDRGYLELFRDIFSVWPVALLLAAPPYLIFRSSAQTFSDVRLTRVLPSAVAEFSFYTFVANLFVTGGGRVANIEGVIPFFLAAVRNALLGARGLQLPSSLLTVTTIVLYLALIVYVAIPDDGRSNLDFPAVLLLPLLGTVTLLAWILLAAEFIPNVIISLTIPSVIIVACIWWIGRGS